MSMVERDYVMRLIYEVIRTLLRLIFHIDIEKKNGALFEYEQYKEKYEALTGLIEKGRLGEAEDHLLTELNVYERRDLELALNFYAYLNEKDNAFLEAHGFSRREIVEGIRMVCTMFGYGTLAESLTDDVDAELY